MKFAQEWKRKWNLHLPQRFFQNIIKIWRRGVFILYKKFLVNQFDQTFWNLIVVVYITTTTIIITEVSRNSRINPSSTLPTMSFRSVLLVKIIILLLSTQNPNTSPHTPTIFWQSLLMACWRIKNLSSLRFWIFVMLMFPSFIDSFSRILQKLFVASLLIILLFTKPQQKTKVIWPKSWPKAEQLWTASRFQKVGRSTRSCKIRLEQAWGNSYCLTDDEKIMERLKRVPVPPRIAGERIHNNDDDENNYEWYVFFLFILFFLTLAVFFFFVLFYFWGFPIVFF